MWIIICIIIIIALVVWSSTKSKDIHATKSSGVFDNVAKTALKNATDRAAANPSDVPAQFAIGRIHRYNIEENAVTPVVLNAYTAVAHRPAEMTDFMIDEVEEILNALGENPVPVARPFAIAATAAIPEARATSKQRRIIAAKGAATRSDAIADYIAASITHTNDPQNVHDTKVNDDLRETLRKLEPADVETAIADARGWIRKNVKNPASALSVLDTISRGDSISTYNTTESDIFSRVWHRCDDKRNAGNSHAMKTAVAGALTESIENGTMVCMSGRVNRVLGSLVLLDHDPSVGSAMTHEAYRNEIFESVGKLIDDNINTAASSNDPEMSAVGNAYLTGTTTDNIAETKFRDSVKQKIDQLVDGYKEKLSVETLDRLKEECYICIE